MGTSLSKSWIILFLRRLEISSRAGIDILDLALPLLRFIDSLAEGFKEADSDSDGDEFLARLVFFETLYSDPTIS